MSLEKQIEAAAGGLPDGWKIRIEVENGSALIRLIRPDETELIVDDGESDLGECFRDACIVAHNENEANRQAALEHFHTHIDPTQPLG